MTINEKAHELGELIKASAEMARLKETEALQAEDENAKELLKEFNLNRMNLARDMQEGKMCKKGIILFGSLILRYSFV